MQVLKQIDTQQKPPKAQENFSYRADGFILGVPTVQPVNGIVNQLTQQLELIKAGFMSRRLGINIWELFWPNVGLVSLKGATPQDVTEFVESLVPGASLVSTAFLSFTWTRNRPGLCVTIVL